MEKLRPTVDRLRVLESALERLGLQPGDLMKELRREKATKARFLHELSATQVEEQITQTLATCERYGK